MFYTAQQLLHIPQALVLRFEGSVDREVIEVTSGDSEAEEVSSGNSPIDVSSGDNGADDSDGSIEPMHG